MPLSTLPKTLSLAATCGIKAAADDSPQKQATFEITANSGNSMRVSGFFDPVVLDLKGVKFRSDVTPVIADHRPELRVGHTTSRSVSKNGVVVKGVVSSTSNVAKAIVADAKNGFPFQSSVGASIVRSEYVEANETAEVNGRTHKGPLIIARESEIQEISILTLGADSETSVAIQAALSNSNPSPKGTPNVPQRINQTRELQALEAERIETINAAFSSFANVDKITHNGRDYTRSEFKATAIREGLSSDAVELALHRSHIAANAPTGPAIHPFSGFNGGNMSEVLQGVFLLRAGYESIGEKTLGPRIMEAANRFRSLSFEALGDMALQAEGIYRHFSSRHEKIKAQFSSHTLTNALGGGFDKILAVTFEEAGATWRSFVAKRPLSNFREHKIISPQHRGQLEELPAQGEIRHGYLTEDTTNLRLATFAKRIGIDRQDVINDDLSIFHTMRQVLAVHAIRKLNDLIYETLMANAGSHFAEGNGNLLTGGGSALSATSLAQAVQYMRKQRDADDNDLDIRPKVLVVSPENEVTAREILSSIQVNKTGDNEPIGNALKDIATLEVEPRLSNTAKFANASATAWYLFSGPESAPVYLGTLDGKESPTVESFGLDAEPSRLMFSYRVYADWGCALGEHRSAVKSNGA